MEENGHDDALFRGVWSAFVRATDAAVLRRELHRCLAEDSGGAAVSVRPRAGEGVAGNSRIESGTPPSGSVREREGERVHVKDDLLRRIVLADILDESILRAKPGDKSFPLRLVFGALSEALPDEGAFALASGLNFYFRAPMDEEIKMRLGLEVSRQYYRFAAAHLGGLVAMQQASPLLAALMNGELAHVRFESVDHLGIFDSSLHERDLGANPHSGSVVRPSTFLCRVTKSAVVRIRAVVVT